MEVGSPNSECMGDWAENSCRYVKHSLTITNRWTYENRTNIEHIQDIFIALLDIIKGIEVTTIHRCTME